MDYNLVFYVPVVENKRPASQKAVLLTLTRVYDMEPQECNATT